MWWPGTELNRRRQPFQAAYYQLIPIIFQQLNFAEWPQFCDHSVTSADVRLSVGPNLNGASCQRPVDLASPRRGLVVQQNATPLRWTVDTRAPCLKDARLQRNRPSGGIDSAHAGVSNKPRATNAAKHGWLQNATKWFDRDEARSREPRHPADVASPLQTVPVGGTHHGSAAEAVSSPVAGFTKCFSRKLIQDPKVAIQSTWRYFGVASVAFRQAFQK